MNWRDGVVCAFAAAAHPVRHDLDGCRYWAFIMCLACRSTCAVRKLPAEEVKGNGDAGIRREGKQEDSTLKE